ncbi:MAG: U32 family peptidase [Maritimibacter sp.]
MELTVGPNPFFWPVDQWSDFYATLASAAPERVVLGELVCSKRLPFYADRLPEAIDKLTSAGKQVVLTSLALVTLPRERKATAALAEAGLEIEVNDLTALTHLPKGTAFSVGPLINCYNETTLTWLAGRGATRICLPPELPLASVTVLAQTAAELGVTVEVWAHGRAPLAISGRCYHARLHGRAKDNCQFACEDDPDGLEIRTLDDEPFLAMNGVQTLSAASLSAVHQVEILREAGVNALRLQPQAQGFDAVCRIWAARRDGQMDGKEAANALACHTHGIRFADGFLTGKKGADWSAGAPPI